MSSCGVPPEDWGDTKPKWIMASKYLPEGAELKVKSIGLQPGENLHERILEDGAASDEVTQFTVEEIKELI